MTTGLTIELFILKQSTVCAVIILFNCWIINILFQRYIRLKSVLTNTFNVMMKHLSKWMQLRQASKGCVLIIMIIFSVYQECMILRQVKHF